MGSGTSRGSANNPQRSLISLANHQKKRSQVVTETAKAQILPFYVVVDVSYSMSEKGPGEQESKLDAANRMVTELRNALAESPTVADKVRVAVLDFSDDAQVVVPLCDLSMKTDIPTCAVRGGTSYIAAFQLLRDQVQSDVSQLKADGFAVHRPAVFFLSDGEPTDEDAAWRQAFTELTHYDKASKTGFPFFPNVIPLGIGPGPETLRELIHPKDRSKAYFMKDGSKAAEALGDMTQLLVASTVQSAASATAGGPALVLPDSDEVGELIDAADADAIYLDD
jgi:uncharacterized protein YegL